MDTAGALCAYEALSWAFFALDVLFFWGFFLKPCDEQKKRSGYETALSQHTLDNPVLSRVASCLNIIINITWD